MPPQFIERTHFSTNDLSFHEQFEAWRESISVIFDVSREVVTPVFNASVTAFRFAGIMIAETHLSSQRYTRSNRRISNDNIDHFMLSLHVTGGWESDSANGLFSGEAGQICINDLAQAIITDKPQSDLIHLIAPREKLEDYQEFIEKMHGQALIGPLSVLLAEYFHMLIGGLGELPAHSGEDLARATANMLSACLKPSPEMLHLAQAPLRTSLLRRAKRRIETQLTSPDLTPDKLAVALGVSRRTLYRTFEAVGGVHDYLLSRRLERVRHELVDENNQQRVSQIAGKYGFSRSDSFSRIFKAHYGVTPLEARKLAGHAPHSARIDSPRLKRYGAWIKELHR